MVFTCLRYISFENTVGKGEIARNEQFLLFPQCFLAVSRTFCHFHQIWNCRLQTFSIWKNLKFVVWERVKRHFLLMFASYRRLLVPDYRRFSQVRKFIVPCFRYFSDIKSWHDSVAVMSRLWSFPMPAVIKESRDVNVIIVIIISRLVVIVFYVENYQCNGNQHFPYATFYLCHNLYIQMIRMTITSFNVYDMVVITSMGRLSMGLVHFLVFVEVEMSEYCIQKRYLNILFKCSSMHIE